MAKCAECGKKVGFFAEQVKAADMLFCGDCGKRYVAFRHKYLECAGKEETDPSNVRNIVWLTILNLVNAERVNIVYENTDAYTGSTVDTEYSWQASKAVALEYAKKAKSQVSADAAGDAFVQEIIDRAEVLTSCSEEETHIKIRGGVGILPAVRFPVWQRVFMTDGLATIDDLKAILSEIPGHEWLTQKD